MGQRAGHEQCMAHVSMALEPGVLREEVLFHTPTLGAEEHGGVNQVHPMVLSSI